MDIFSKIDLHIHSCASGKMKTGDLDITKNSNINNINLLVSKLNENGINVCAITDHNTFDKNLYLALKGYECLEYSIKKVLPGIEIDLQLNGSVVHTICIFNDEANNHADLIKNNFVEKQNYSLSDLGEILSNIGLDVILIAHQKTDYLGENQHPTNLSDCGIETFYRMIDAEYFDSLEVQSSKVEGILRNRFVKDSINNQSLISGSDCHDWTVYPLHDSKKKNKPLLINMKAEPSFRGLVMAITNNKRFVSDQIMSRKPFIESINLEVRGESLSLPLSYGINAIIGDNSVGKSTLIKALINDVPKEALDFYARHNVKVIPANICKEDYKFNKQGDIRKKFETTEGKLPIKEDFKFLFKDIDTTKYKEQIKNIFEKFTELWSDNEMRHVNNESLKRRLNVSAYNCKNSYFLSFINQVSPLINKYSGITKNAQSKLDSIVQFYNSFKSFLEEEDVERLRDAFKTFRSIKDKYSQKEVGVIFENRIKSCFLNACTTYNKDTLECKSTEEANYNVYLDEYSQITAEISKKVYYDNTKQIDPFYKFEDIMIVSLDTPINDYHFITKPINSKLITKDVIIDFIKNKINIDDLYKAQSSVVLSSISSKRFNDKVCSNLNELKDALATEFYKEYFATTIEIKHGNDNLDEGNSAGINSLYYLDIESYTFKKQLYITDQPEDDVSQTKINTVLINSLRNFANKSQVIIVTHNPQLVVNLDVDNVIVVKKDEDSGNIDFISGPLERKDNIDMLKLVADTLEGGIDAIKKRWKRYEKAN